MKEKIILVLEGNNAIINENDKLTWYIDDHLFKNIAGDIKFEMSLVQCKFICKNDNALNDFNTYTASIYCNLLSLNQGNTNYKHLLSNVDIKYTDNNDTGNLTLIYNTNCNITHPLKNIVYKFNQIDVQISYNDANMEFATNVLGINKNYCNFIFELIPITNNN